MAIRAGRLGPTLRHRVLRRLGECDRSAGELYQSSFHGGFISRVDRDGSVSTYADSGLVGPVGIAMGDHDALYVVDCSANAVARVDTDHTVHRLADGPLFACPNGITRDDQGDFYVVNFGNTKVIRITPEGSAEVFADIPGSGGNGHIIFGRDGFYVTKFRGHQVFRLERDGHSRVVAGTGTQGHRDGPATEALLSQPNGIAISPAGDVLWINELISGNGVGGGAAHAIIRRIRLIGLTDVLATAAPGVEGLTSSLPCLSERPTRRGDQHRRDRHGIPLPLRSAGAGGAGTLPPQRRRSSR